MLALSLPCKVERGKECAWPDDLTAFTGRCQSSTSLSLPRQHAQAIHGAYLVPDTMHDADPDGQDPRIGQPLRLRPLWLL
eukprot:2380091-Amphidinium_carterae.1